MKYILLIASMLVSACSFSQIGTKVEQEHKVTLKQAHVGSLQYDTLLLDSYGKPPENTRKFYLQSRMVFKTDGVDFTDQKIVKAAQENKVVLMSGPILGDVRADAISIWLRTSTKHSIKIKVNSLTQKKEFTFKLKGGKAGDARTIRIDGLSPNTAYSYGIYLKKKKLAEGSFTTAPTPSDKSQLRIAFGSCFHKIGLHNPNLVHAIRERNPQAMMLLGDIAVDDRENKINMHRADYLLRDVSPAWKSLAGNVPLYATWDDHDYLNNDLSGIPKRFTIDDRNALREVWKQNWNNPQNNHEGIYFKKRIGQAELFMLDTRSCRTVQERGKYASYLGVAQIEWLKQSLKQSTAEFKLISSGTMWSDYVTKGKDSWGTWDKKAREELFHFIETEKISGVILISGDRHGARGFTIPRSKGFKLYEFEAATLGGVPGPPAMIKNREHQLFGYYGSDIIAFGEFTFDYAETKPKVTFRLIDQYGEIKEEIELNYDDLSVN